MVLNIIVFSEHSRDTPKSATRRFGSFGNGARPRGTPRSSKTSRDVGETKTFNALMSRCTTFCSCKANKPRQTCSKASQTQSSGRK